MNNGKQEQEEETQEQLLLGRRIEGEGSQNQEDSILQLSTQAEAETASEKRI